jgi:hypothetical protein
MTLMGTLLAIPEPVGIPLRSDCHPLSRFRRHLLLAACRTSMAAVESTTIAGAMPTIVADLGGFSLGSGAAVG